MDGGHEDASINLRKEFIRADNINALLAKYDVPAAFDLLVVDIDFNDFWVLKVREVLARRPPWQKPPSLKFQNDARAVLTWAAVYSACGGLVGRQSWTLAGAALA